MKEQLISELNSYAESNKEFKKFREKFTKENKFYKYRSFNYNNFMALIEERVYLSDPKEFNDPFDCCYNVCSTRVIEEIKLLFKKRKTVSLEDISELEIFIKDDNVEEFKNKYTSMIEKYKFTAKEFNVNFEKLEVDFKVCSFSAKKDSILMWSHYSDYHKGYCIELELFNTDSLYPVFYSDSLKIGTGKIKKSIKLFSALVKAKEWDYEDEYRVIEKKNSENESLKVKIKTIYLGARFENKVLKKILEYTSEKKGYEIKQMKISEEDFTLLEDKDFKPESHSFESIKKEIKNKDELKLSDKEKEYLIEVLEKINKKRLL